MFAEKMVLGAGMQGRPPAAALRENPRPPPRPRSMFPAGSSDNRLTLPNPRQTDQLAARQDECCQRQHRHDANHQQDQAGDDQHDTNRGAQDRVPAQRRS